MLQATLPLQAAQPAAGSVRIKTDGCLIGLQLPTDGGLWSTLVRRLVCNLDLTKHVLKHLIITSQIHLSLSTIRDELPVGTHVKLNSTMS